MYERASKGTLGEGPIFRLAPECPPGREAEAAGLLGVNQPKVSALMHDKLDGLSVEHLMARLGRDVEIVVRKKLRSRAKAHTSVVAA